MVVDRIEFVPVPAIGAARVFRSEYRVRLADVTPSNRLRMDAIARVLQDVSSDDTAHANSIVEPSLRSTEVWVLRRLALRVGNLPGFQRNLDVGTWCSGIGRCWAERRTEMHPGGSGPAVDAAALWVCTDPVTGAPIAPGPTFHAMFGAAANGRRIGSRLSLPGVPANARTERWAVRASDFDVLGHVNNASYWYPVEMELERSPRRIDAACIEFRGGVEPGEVVTVATVDTPTQLDQWWLVDGSVRAALTVRFGG